MIISLVSDWNHIGKSTLARKAREFLYLKRYSFALPLWEAASKFIGDEFGKDDIHPDLGITRRQIVGAIAASLTPLHHDLSVYKVKKRIESCAVIGHNVVIDDTRRLSEFVWLDKLAKETGTVHEVIEIAAPDKPESYPLRLTQDTWSNGLEPCGRAAWPTERTIIANHGSDVFWVVAIGTINTLVMNETARQAELHQEIGA